MKKLSMIAASLLLATTISFAQVVEEVEIKKLETEKLVAGGFWDNWFISVGAGVTSNYITGNSFSTLNDNVSFAFEASLGKWYNPIFGGRLQYRGFETVTNIDSNTEISWTPFQMHADLLINAMNLFGGYNSERIYDLIPYAGLGYMGYDKYNAANELFFTAGLINRFRVGEALDINLELSASAVSGRAVPTMQSPGYLFIPMSATVGLTYNFGKDSARDFEKVQTIVDEAVLPYEEAIGGLVLANGELADEAAMLAKNNQALKDSEKALQDKVADLEKQLEECKAKPVKKIEVVKGLMNDAIYSALFKNNSYRLANSDRERLVMLASEIKSVGGKYIIEGYSDLSTGSASYNRELSKKRANAVYSVLVDELGVNPAYFTYVGVGNSELFKEIELNRKVVVRTVQ